MANVVLAFDIYGTLLDTSAIADALVSHAHVTHEKAKEVAALWRRYQLEYTWRLNSMEIYEPFDEVTKKSLLHASADAGVNPSSQAVSSLMEAYHQLPSFDDTAPSINKLLDNANVDIVMFSNGTQKMVEAALSSAGLLPRISTFYVADDVKKYKPSPAIYSGLLATLKRENDPQSCWLVSCNPFDVTGARTFGMNAIWVDRAGTGWLDRLYGPGPTRIVRSLEEVTRLSFS